jgi:hypothetical protein
MVSALEQPSVPKIRYVAGTLMLIVLAMRRRRTSR